MRFVAALRCLCDVQVEFVVIGGVAASLHGSATVTLDLDICYSRNAGNLEKLAAALAPHHPNLRDLPSALAFVWDASVLRNGMNFTLTTDLGDIDLFGEVTGVGAYVDIQGHTRTSRAFGMTFEIIGLELLIQSKRAAGRAKDLLVLPELESLRDAQ
jgi:hypothetical protein